MGWLWKEEGENQILYLRARSYDPKTGRFTQEDVARDGGNWYAYCYNNPIALKDPTGCIAGVDDVLIYYFFQWLLEAAITAETGNSAYYGGGGSLALPDISSGGLSLPKLPASGFSLPELPSMPDIAEGMAAGAASSAASMVYMARTLKDIREADHVAMQDAYENGVYYLAFVDTKTGSLAPITGAISYEEAYEALFVTAGANELTKVQKFVYNEFSDPANKIFGIYTYEQAHAKALAIPLGLYEGNVHTKYPEYHYGINMDEDWYGHYHGWFKPFHDEMHIWYGNKIDR